LDLVPKIIKRWLMILSVSQWFPDRPKRRIFRKRLHRLWKMKGGLWAGGPRNLPGTSRRPPGISGFDSVSTGL